MFYLLRKLKGVMTTDSQAVVVVWYYVKVVGRFIPFSLDTHNPIFLVQCEIVNNTRFIFYDDKSHLHGMKDCNNKHLNNDATTFSLRLATARIRWIR